MSERNANNCQEDHHDDLAAYSLGALTGSEAAALENHLATCEACTERLHWLQPAVHLIPASVSQLDAPPELGERLMAIVREEAAEQAPVAAKPARSVGSRIQSFLQHLAPMRPALAGFAAMALVVAAVGGYAIRGGEGQPQSYAALPASPQSDASGTLTVADGEGTLQVDNLPPAPQDEVYQAWIAHDGKVSPSSIFVIDHNGHGSAVVPGIPGNADQVMVTREPSGGSEQPTTGVVVAAALE